MLKIKENKNNYVILEDEKNDLTYLYSYNSLIAVVCNTIDNKKNNYGLKLTNKWNYSQTTLKQLYYFIELYTTQRDNTGNTIAYMLSNKKNKKEYIKELINNKNIELMEE